MATREQYNQLVKAFQTLAGVCDGAQQQDGMGFNGTDTIFGRSVAEQSFHTILTPGQQRPMIKLIQKYRHQLENYGVEDLPSMADYGEPFQAEESVAAAKEADVVAAAKEADVVIVGRNGKVWVRFTRNIRENADKIKTLEWGLRKWDAAERQWVVDPRGAASVLAMFPEADVDPRVQAYVDGKTVVTEETGEPVLVEAEAVPVRVVKMSVRLVKDKIVMTTPEYRPQWVEDCREVPGRKFGDTKEHGKHWNAPTSAVTYIVENWKDRDDIDLDPALFALHDNLMSRASKSRIAHGELVDDLPIPEGLEPFPYQQAGYNFLKEAGFRGLLADDMGLGKTIQAILAIMAVREEGPVVVSCPATVKLNWARELKKWIPGIRVQILDGRTPKFALDVRQWDVFVINHDILAYKKDGELKGWIEQFLALRIALFIFDEGHKVGNPKAIRGAAAKTIAKEVNRVIFLTGTPLPNRPRELYPILNMVDPSAWGNWWDYAKRYCGAVNNGYGWDFNGATNLEELHQRIRPWVLRRTKEQVLTELPGKTRTDIVLPLPDKARREYNDRIKKYAYLVRSNQAQGHDKLTLISDLKQLIAAAKLEQSIDWIKDFTESGRKLIVFAWHTAVIDGVMDAMAKSKIGAVKLTGSTSLKDRQAAVDRFQNDPDTLVFVGNIQAAGEGITLTAAADVVFLEYAWKPGQHAQAEDRANRIGQTQAVTVWYLNAQDTIDGTLFGIIDGKRQVIDMVIDGETKQHESEVMFMDHGVTEETDVDLVTALVSSSFLGSKVDG